MCLWSLSCPRGGQNYSDCALLQSFADLGSFTLDAFGCRTGCHYKRFIEIFGSWNWLCSADAHLSANLFEPGGQQEFASKGHASSWYGTLLPAGDSWSWCKLKWRWLLYLFENRSKSAPSREFCGAHLLLAYDFGCFLCHGGWSHPEYYSNVRSIRASTRLSRQGLCVCFVWGVHLEMGHKSYLSWISVPGSIQYARCSQESDAQSIRREIGDQVHRVDHAIHVLLTAGMSTPALRDIAHSVNIENAAFSEITGAVLLLGPVAIVAPIMTFFGFFYGENVWFRTVLSIVSVLSRLILFVFLWRSSWDEQRFILKVMSKFLFVAMFGWLILVSSFFMMHADALAVSNVWLFIIDVCLLSMLSFALFGIRGTAKLPCGLQALQFFFSRGSNAWHALKVSGLIQRFCLQVTTQVTVSMFWTEASGLKSLILLLGGRATNPSDIAAFVMFHFGPLAQPRSVARMMERRPLRTASPRMTDGWTPCTAESSWIDKLDPEGAAFRQEINFAIRSRYQHLLDSNWRKK